MFYTKKYNFNETFNIFFKYVEIITYNKNLVKTYKNLCFFIKMLLNCFICCAAARSRQWRLRQPNKLWTVLDCTVLHFVVFMNESKNIFFRIFGISHKIGLNRLYTALNLSEWCKTSLYNISWRGAYSSNHNLLI